MRKSLLWAALTLFVGVTFLTGLSVPSNSSGEQVTTTTSTVPQVNYGAAEAAVAQYEAQVAADKKAQLEAFFAEQARLEAERIEAAKKKEAQRKAQAASTPKATYSGGSDMERFLACVKQRESGGDYTARNPRSTAAGAYQFLDSTARLVAKWMGRPDLSSDAATWSPADQEAGARVLYQHMGKSPWHYPASPC